MTSVRVGDVNVSVIFKTEVVQRLAKDGIEDITMVRCGFIGTDSRVLALGNAFCSPLDTVDLTLGMELAFGRALRKLAPFDKALRTQFWDMFYNALSWQQVKATQLDEQFEAQLTEWLAAPRDVSDAEPVDGLTAEKQDRLTDLRKRLPAAQADHALWGYTDDCGICIAMRKELAALEEEAGN